MTPSVDRDFRQELASKATAVALSKSLRMLLGVLILLVVMQIGLLFWVSGQCSTVYGLSVEGRIFNTYSFTCHNPGIEPLYRGAPAQNVTASL